VAAAGGEGTGGVPVTPAPSPLKVFDGKESVARKRVGRVAWFAVQGKRMAAAGYRRMSGGNSRRGSKRLYSLETVKHRLDDETIEALRSKFKKYDTDKSGSVSTAELRILTRDLGFRFSRGGLRRLADQLDRSGEGRISFGEFVLWFDLQVQVRDRARAPAERVTREGSGWGKGDCPLTMCALCAPARDCPPAKKKKKKKKAQNAFEQEERRKHGWRKHVARLSAAFRLPPRAKLVIAWATMWTIFGVLGLLAITYSRVFGPAQTKLMVISWGMAEGQALMLEVRASHRPPHAAAAMP
jgi:hypothetical protein